MAFPTQYSLVPQAGLVLPKERSTSASKKLRAALDILAKFENASTKNYFAVLLLAANTFHVML
jgi:hypothetical protein